MNDRATSTTEAAPGGTRSLVLTFGVAIFLGAFLLFQVQPIIARFILPWFGGTTDVWTTCMLYFQTMLLIGYAYAHLIAVYLRPRGQVIVHLVLVAAAVAVLPIMPSETWRPPDASWPIPRILAILAVCTGLPFMVLAATSPLMQSWFTRTAKGRSPYRFYAVSNAGSLLALVSYPFVFEPLLGRVDQSLVWSAGVGVFAVIAVVCGVRLWRGGADELPPAAEALRVDEGGGADSASHGRWWWIAFPAVGSVLLLGTTNLVCQDLTPVPFLWIVPLALYLLTFVLCFHQESFYQRGRMLIGLVLVGAGVFFVRYKMKDISISIPMRTGLYIVAMFVGCMICHGEVFRLRPPAKRLTGYYLAIALGGALGGVAVAVVAPLVLSDYLEVYLALPVCLMLAMWVRPKGIPAAVRYASTVAAVGAMIVALVAPAFTTSGFESILIGRNFYGVLRVAEERGNPKSTRRVMRHGTTLHGFQVIRPAALRSWPVCYYGPNSGIGLAMRLLEHRSNRTIGVIGLGTGTIAAYGRPGDVVHFYEINPQVERLAQEQFFYITDSRADVDVILGDGRLSVEKVPSGTFDVLVVDAFNSDAIPVHLLTKEAFAIYLDRLKPGGVLALHLTNNFLSLGPIAFRVADELGWPAYGLNSSVLSAAALRKKTESPSTWVVVTRRRDVKSDVLITTSDDVRENIRASISLWTDDFVNILQAIGRR